VVGKFMMHSGRSFRTTSVTATGPLFSDWTFNRFAWGCSHRPPGQSSDGTRKYPYSTLKFGSEDVDAAACLSELYDQSRTRPIPNTPMGIAAIV
jgi:hypothetical protein